jgi:hypothetical protein
LTSLRRSIAISMEEGPAHGAQPTPHGVATPSAGALRPSKYSGTMANPGWLTAGLGGYAKGPRHHLWRQDPWPAVLLVAGEPRRPALVPLTLATPPRRKAPARASATRCSCPDQSTGHRHRRARLISRDPVIDNAASHRVASPSRTGALQTAGTTRHGWTLLFWRAHQRHRARVAMRFMLLDPTDLPVGRQWLTAQRSQARRAK